ncbi:MAG: oligopeptide transport system substrate-binding protein [Pseudohongiellaceae bacterium]|jgi:oligopeptide transport system substrate-binding protein
MTIIKITSLLMVALLGFLLTACGGGETNVSTGNREGILHFGNGAEPQELDPHIVTGVPEHHIISALLEGLVSKNPKTLEPMPAVAESWSVSDDGKIYTFNLRPNAKWSNGDAVTAEDFVWSWQRGLTPAMGNQYAYMYYAIKNAEAFAKGKISDFSKVGVKAINHKTLRVELNNATPYFLQLLDHYSLFPVHRPTIEKFGEPAERGTLWTRAGTFVGNGPFTLTQWDLNKVIIVEKNPLYWDAKTVKLKGIYFYPTENLTTEERMFRAGQLHYTNSVPVEKIAIYKKENPHLIRVSAYLGSYFYRINTRLEHLKDVRVRRALAMAIDREAIANKLLKAGQIAAYAITPNNTMGYTADTDLRYDVAEARRLLAEAGYPNGEGFPTTDILYNTQEDHRKVAVAIQQMWKKSLNINITIQNQDWKVFLDSVSSGNYSIARAGWIGDYVDPNSFLDMWITDGGVNRTGWSNAEYDRLVLEVAPKAKTVEQRYVALRKAEKMLLDDMPVIPIYTYVSKHLVHPSVKNLSPNLLDTPYYKYIYLEPEVATARSQ